MSDTHADWQVVSSASAGMTPPTTNGSTKPSRPDPDAYRTELQARLADAEKELTKDQRSLEVLRAKVDELAYSVWFLELQVGSRTKEVAEFDRLRKKTAK